MFRLIESIRVSDGRLTNPDYHKRRMEQSIRVVYGVEREIDLAIMVRPDTLPESGLFKCRLVYDNKMNTVEFSPYSLRPVRSLRIVHADRLRYDHKFEDRREIDEQFGHRQKCDDVLIIREGKVTDTSYANVVFRQEGTWFTPDSFLLPGTTRQRLLDERVVSAREILETDLVQFDAVKLINALMMFDAPEIPIQNIVA